MQCANMIVEFYIFHSSPHTHHRQILYQKQYVVEQNAKGIMDETESDNAPLQQYLTGVCVCTEETNKME